MIVFQIPDDAGFVQDLLDADLPFAEVARIMDVSRPTLYSFCREHGIEQRTFSDISDDQLVDVVIELKRNHPNDGYVLMEGHLRAMGLKIQRWKIRAAVKFVDGEGVEARKTKTIKRRSYSVPCPHYMWHIGLYLK